MRRITRHQSQKCAILVHNHFFNTLIMQKRRSWYHYPIITFHGWSPELKLARQAKQKASKEAREQANGHHKHEGLQTAKQELKNMWRSASKFQREFLQGQISEITETQNCSESSAKKHILDCEQSKELFSLNQVLMYGPWQSTMASVPGPIGNEGI